MRFLREIFEFGVFFVMETFGLLNFLNSLLAKTEKTDENATTNEPKQTNCLEEKRTENQTESMSENGKETEKYNAFLSFIEAHDLRAKNTKK